MTSDDSDFYRDLLQDADHGVQTAQKQMNEAEQRRRVRAAIALRAGLTKTQISNLLGISRPTLDAWLAMVAETPDEQKQVETHFALVRRMNTRAAATQP